MIDQEVDRAQATEILKFQVNYNRRRIKATWALAVLIAVMFFLEEMFGGSQNIAVLVRMGANVSDRVISGEYFRLFSCVFLHAGWMHVFFNSYVLFALGGFFNRILGEAQYLTVFFASGLAGSLASVFFGKSAISVGASGAIWGLFGASLALAVFRSSLLPEAIRLRLRRVTVINLVINLGISFLPMIDFWAHIGGGVAGFLISLPIMFQARGERSHLWSLLFFRLVATGMALIYISSIGYAMLRFQPWVDQLSAKLVPISLSDVPFSMAIPQGLEHEKGPKNTSKQASHVFGDPHIDRVVIETNFFHKSILGFEVNKDWLVAQRREMISDPSIAAAVKKTVDLRETSDGAVLYYQQAAKHRDAAIHNFIIARNGYAIKISLVVVEKTSQARVDALAKSMIDSITAD